MTKLCKKLSNLKTFLNKYFYLNLPFNKQICNFFFLQSSRKIKNHLTAIRRYYKKLNKYKLKQFYNMKYIFTVDFDRWEENWATPY